MIFLPGNVPSLKNSKIAVPGKGVFHSKTVKKYLSSLGIQNYSASKKWVHEYKTRPNIFRDILEGYFTAPGYVEYPITIQFHFVRDSVRKFDFVNVSQIVLDLLTAHDYIPDDNMDCVIPENMKRNGLNYSIDRKEPGVWININNIEDNTT